MLTTCGTASVEGLENGYPVSALMQGLPDVVDRSLKAPMHTSMTRSADGSWLQQ